MLKINPQTGETEEISLYLKNHIPVDLAEDVIVLA